MADHFQIMKRFIKPQLIDLKPQICNTITQKLISEPVIHKITKPIKNHLPWYIKCNWQPMGAEFSKSWYILLNPNSFIANPRYDSQAPSGSPIDCQQIASISQADHQRITSRLPTDCQWIIAKYRQRSI